MKISSTNRMNCSLNSSNFFYGRIIPLIFIYLISLKKKIHIKNKKLQKNIIVKNYR